MRKGRKWPLIFPIAATAALLLLLHVRTAPPKPLLRPEDTSLEFWITEDVGQMDWSGYEQPAYAFGAYIYLGKDYAMVWANGMPQPPEAHVIYTVTAWPDYADGGAYVTEIKISDPAVTVYGLTARSSFDAFDRLFREKGYEIHTAKTDLAEQHTAVKNGITFDLRHFRFSKEGPEQALLFIYAQVTNREGIVF